MLEKTELDTFKLLGILFSLKRGRENVSSPFIVPDKKENYMPEYTCYIELFPHSLPHRDEAQLRPCGHYACDPHTITYYGTGDDEELEGDYCMVCYAKKFPQNCPDRLLRQAILEGH